VQTTANDGTTFVEASTEPRWLNLVSCALAVAAKASPTSSQDIPLVDCGDLPKKTGAAHKNPMTYHLIGIQNPLKKKNRVRLLLLDSPMFAALTI